MLSASLRKCHTEKNLTNGSDLEQPDDCFVSQKRTAAWRALWDARMLSMIENGMWLDPRKGSGKLVNSGKAYFLRLAADAVRDVDQQRDTDGILFVRKAMVRCGIYLTLNGQWEEHQLFPRLQEIIKKYQDNF